MADSMGDLLHDLREANQEDFARRTTRLCGATASTPAAPSDALAAARRTTRTAGRTGPAASS